MNVFVAINTKNSYASSELRLVEFPYRYGPVTVCPNTKTQHRFFVDTHTMFIPLKVLPIYTTQLCKWAVTLLFGDNWEKRFRKSYVPVHKIVLL